MTYFRLFTGLITGSAILMMGCAAPKAAESQSAKIENQAYAKPGASVSFTHAYKGQVEPGESGEIDVFIQEGYDVGTLDLSVTSEEGLQTYPTSTQARYDMSEGNQHVMTIYFTGTTQGRHYLNIMAAADDGSGKIARRAHSIAIQVGDAANNAKAANPDMQTTPSGESLIIMDAEETIDPK